MNIAYEVRDNRKGYKAGALKKGMEHDYVQKCEYVAIFDADFQPDSDFLLKTIPFLVHNSKIGLVQARWDFGKLFPLYTCNCHIVVVLLCKYRNIYIQQQPCYSIKHWCILTSKSFSSIIEIKEERYNKLVLQDYCIT